MRQANDTMTTAEQVTFAWVHRERFADAARHNLDVIAARRRGDWNNRYRNAWAELAESNPLTGC